MKKFFILGVIVCLLIITAFLSMTTISSGTVGVMKVMGAVQDGALTEGFHFIPPFISSVEKMNIQTQKIDADCAAATKDLQTIAVSVAVNYRVNGDTAPKLYKTVGKSYANVLIPPAIQESVKAVCAQYSAEEMITKRQEAGMKILEKLKEKIQSYGITVEIFNITNLDFSDSFNKAIEAKQTAQQDALKAQQDLTRIRIEAEQTVVNAQAQADAEKAKAEAEAYAIGIIQKQLAQSPDYIRYQTIQKWNGILPQVQGDSTPIVDIR